MCQKPPRNPNRTLSKKDHPKVDELSNNHQFHQYNSTNTLEKRASSLSKLGSQNFKQMVQPQHQGYESPHRNNVNQTIDVSIKYLHNNFVN